jgi:enamine deaminase RidA (YjgF/YER057c/UK114 family)
MAEAQKRHYIKREGSQARAYSPAIITEGGRIVWLAGQTTLQNLQGKDVSGDFDGQVHDIFARLGKTLEEAGGKLGDMTTMTVFITDTRLGDRFTELRREIFGDNFPASAMINIRSLAQPDLLIEIQSIAVIG